MSKTKIANTLLQSSFPESKVSYFLLSFRSRSFLRTTSSIIQ